MTLVCTFEIIGERVIPSRRCSSRTPRRKYRTRRRPETTISTAGMRNQGSDTPDATSEAQQKSKRLVDVSSTRGILPSMLSMSPAKRLMIRPSAQEVVNEAARSRMKAEALTRCRVEEGGGSSHNGDEDSVVKVSRGATGTGGVEAGAEDLEEEKGSYYPCQHTHIHSLIQLSTLCLSRLHLRHPVRQPELHTKSHASSHDCQSEKEGDREATASCPCIVSQRLAADRSLLLLFLLHQLSTGLVVGRRRRSYNRTGNNRVGLRTRAAGAANLSRCQFQRDIFGLSFFCITWQGRTYNALSKDGDYLREEEKVVPGSGEVVMDCPSVEV